MLCTGDNQMRGSFHFYSFSRGDPPLQACGVRNNGYDKHMGYRYA